MGLLRTLRVRHFRNLAEADLDFGPGANIFVGDNAQGKTNLLESILYLATATTPRTTRHFELIQKGQQTAYVAGTLRDDGGETKLELGLERGAKRVKVDGAVLPRIQDLYGRMRVVFLAPEDLEVISGPPAERRRFLDMTISQVRPEHIGTLQSYQRAVQQRNSGLRQVRFHGQEPSQAAELDAWESQCAALGADVLARRWIMIRDFGPLLSRSYEHLAGHGLELEYMGEVWGSDPEECRRDLAERFFARRESDLESETTSVGPHRDDVRFRVRDVVLRSFGSQGERRSAALALRLAEADYMRAQTGADPILLVDDVIHEMDRGRRSAFLDALRHRGQVFFTVTELSHLGDLAAEARIFRVKAGSVSEVARGSEGPAA